MAPLSPKHCLLFGCFCFIMVNLSTCTDFRQRPRYLGVRSGSKIILFCFTTRNNNVTHKVEWVKILQHGEKEEMPVFENRKVKLQAFSKENRASLTISGVTHEDSGIYVCKVNNLEGPGSELQVYSHMTPDEVQKKTQMKDAIILIQAALLMLCLLTPLLLYIYQGKSEERDYEEPEDDHTYEGLEIEQCAMYEDIATLRQPAEATWEHGEHPCQE
ncbi:B-cell antigen receptor complex-associated protein beta chain [Amia ocellicauda]|uniref:B-cell antigen receptor complex-associated protein beta chain n=1 Tax=Amia ocellicauda TaxID=2972642 RepID=UPI0034639E66